MIAVILATCDLKSRPVIVTELIPESTKADKTGSGSVGRMPGAFFYTILVVLLTFCSSEANRDSADNEGSQQKELLVVTKINYLKLNWNEYSFCQRCDRIALLTTKPCS